MIGYVCIGTNDLPRAARFYDELTAVLGAKRMWDEERYIASVGNGTMVSLQADSRAQVDAVYNRALALGGTDEGPPGARSEDFYAAFFRDPEGNKLAVFYSG
jgi:catechol 2,3-dioxygenase-like lactoylglutathione lyase family enzyme